MISTEDVVAITQNILGTMLQMDASFAPSAPPDTEAAQLIGCIQISGQWCGTVIVRTSADLATSAASRMLMMNVDCVELADLQDTLAELTNMIGGNIKSIMPSPSSLSLPMVSAGRDLNAWAIGSKPISETHFLCESHGLSVEIYEELQGN